MSAAIAQQNLTDTRIVELVRAEQVRLLFAHSPLPICLATLFAAGMGLVIQQDVDKLKVLSWIFLKILSAAPRLVQVYLYQRSRQQLDSIWYNSFLAFLLVDGAVWGMAGSWLLPYEKLDVGALVAACMLGSAALSTFVLQADARANAIFILPMLIPTALTIGQRQDFYGAFGGLSVGLFIVLLLLEGRRAEMNLVELLRLRFITDRVAQERATALLQAERSSAVKSQFLATMSHEMRTPLHGILGLTRLVHDQESNEGLRRQLELVERSGEHLLTVINDVLDFSKIDAGHLQISCHPFDLTQVIHDVCELWRVPAASKNLELRLQFHLSLPCHVIGDAPRIRQVLHNLLGNAVKFTDQGHVILKVEHDTQQNKVLMTVEDSGIGIAIEDLPRIFEAFHQVDNSIGRRYSGTGLGLTISREISRAMGGDLTCSSTPGKGSTFVFSVPLPPAPETQADISRQTGIGPNRKAYTTAPLSFDASEPLSGHVLLVEDNMVNALLAEATLQRLGLGATVVANGQEALESVQRQAPDLILMDCEMPLMNGFEATRRIRAFERRLGRKSVPIIALTASALEADRDRCSAAGMDDHLSKPFSSQELEKMLHRYLVKHSHEMT